MYIKQKDRHFVREFRIFLVSRGPEYLPKKRYNALMQVHREYLNTQCGVTNIYDVLQSRLLIFNTTIFDTKICIFLTRQLFSLPVLKDLMRPQCK